MGGGREALRREDRLSLAIAIKASDAWRERHPRAVIGILEISGVANGSTAALEERKRAIEAALRGRYKGFSRGDFVAVSPVLAEYVRYYKSFGKTYHVQLQLESIVLKGKSLPSISPLVDANFMAEVETLVLTAGHDAARLQPPVTIDVGAPGERMTQMNGARASMQAGDMVMREAGGIACSILYGQDNRSPISAATTRALYVAYGVPGVGQDVVAAQFARIVEYLRQLARGCVVEQEEYIQ
jgi:DNA/RNA-binding domain of Phe-tRNA-synthetase-like protein